ncbi:hypothetical protein SAMN05421837_101155 [Amycolatopsis pretoriensis]|uniref:Uncharacterized protein n=1 Tax=Amycolatopsis pretoriensis TaxID=218821 RepID=A0A1H5Q1F4_9PSEU|nr:hypothetical protein [Amycolatopsis pretoriensis]SEF19920.1 hypothetical protein SAMN05421837_101155 [Amycolatopsis pretoriensis]
MDTLPEDPLGPPVIGQAAPLVTARNQALAGRDPRRDIFIQTTTISLHPEDS